MSASGIPWLCRIGFHRFGKVDNPDGNVHQVCRRCGFDKTEAPPPEHRTQPDGRPGGYNDSF